MKQPTKDTLREQLALAADEIIRLRAICFAAQDVMTEAKDIVAEFDKLLKPWWRRLWDKCKSACEGGSP